MTAAEKDGAALTPRTQRGSTQAFDRRDEMWMTIVAPFIVPMATLCGPLWFLGRKRVQWSWVDFTVAWLPLLVWFGLMRLNLMSKSLSNLGESLIVGGLTPICPAIRLVGREWMTENRLALATAALGIAMAAAVYFFTPCWPE